MTEQEFLIKMKTDLLDVENDITADTTLDSIEEWDSLAIIDFIARANSVCNKKIQRVDVVGAKTFGDLYALIK